MQYRINACHINSQFNGMSHDGLVLSIHVYFLVQQPVLDDFYRICPGSVLKSFNPFFALI